MVEKVSLQVFLRMEILDKETLRKNLSGNLTFSGKLMILSQYCISPFLK